MPFQKGHPPYTNGRPRKGESLKELLGQVGVDTKRELVKVAYQRAIDGDYHWADWIARHSGEGANFVFEVNTAGPWAQVMSNIMERVGMGAIEGESRLLPASDSEDLGA